MMRNRIGIFFAAFAALAAIAHASNLINSPQLAAVGGTRPTLVGTAGSFSQGNASLRAVSVTVPVGTSLIVVYVGAPGDGDANRAFETLTLNGTAMNLLTPFVQQGSCCIYGMAYRINPTAGTYDIQLTVINGVWQSSIIYAWMFSGTNPSDPIGIVKEIHSGSAQQISIDAQPEYGRPYIVAGSTTRSNGSGSCYSFTNLTLILQGSEGSDNDAAAVASNDTLVGAPSTTFTARCSWASGNRGFTLVEVKGP